MFLTSSVVANFVALHEGSIVGEKTQPVVELYSQEKYTWFGHVTCEFMTTRKHLRKSFNQLRTAGERKTSPFPWDPDAK